MFFRDAIYKCWSRDFLQLGYLPSLQYNHVDWAHCAIDLRDTVDHSEYPVSFGLEKGPSEKHHCGVADSVQKAVISNRQTGAAN
ncbi:Uncharacterised protein [BD1-7 clade bacterium]|uniref:Uncharacterized protein n=1 Tax=BD1-7 clade bacterium TaxID=2029982 RepID=A0A5S9QDB1_9GAMM|nr:Uncharacterised protein [BD1-7 clade bacterium]